MKNIIVFESYVSTVNQGLNPIVTRVPDLSGGYDRLADNYIWEISKTYDIGKGKLYNPEHGNSAWFAKDFLRWCELQRIPVEILVFPKTKEREQHIAILADGVVIDFTYKKFSKKKDQSYRICILEDYKKLGFNVDAVENYPYLPDWVKKINPPKVKK
jgi:hypothetical protein